MGDLWQCLRDDSDAAVRWLVRTACRDESLWGTDLTELDGFADAVDGLARSLRSYMKAEGDASKVIRAQARSAWFTGDLIDIRTFCRELRSAKVDDKVKDAAKQVLDALKPGRYVVAEGHLGPSVDGVGGVTLYFPPPLTKPSRYYKDLAFAKRGWDEFLRSYQRAERGE